MGFSLGFSFGATLAMPRRRGLLLTESTRRGPFFFFRSSRGVVPGRFVGMDRATVPSAVVEQHCGVFFTFH